MRKMVVEQINEITITTDEENRRERKRSVEPSSPERYCESEKSLKQINDEPLAYLIAVKIPVNSPIRPKISRKRVVFLCSLNPSKIRYLTPPKCLEKLFMVYYIRFFDTKLQNFTLTSSNQCRRHILLLDPTQKHV